MRTWGRISWSLGLPCGPPFIKEKILSIGISPKQIIKNDKNVCTENVEKNLKANSTIS